MNFISGRSSSNLVAASFEVSKVTAKHGKPLSYGDYIKEAWLGYLFIKNLFIHEEALCESRAEGTSGSNANSYQSCKLHFCSSIT